MMLLDVKRASWCGESKRGIYMELPGQGPRSRDESMLAMLRMATRYSHQIWDEMPEKEIQKISFGSSVLNIVVF